MNPFKKIAPTPGYDPEAARALARLSQLSYESERQAQIRCLSWGMKARLVSRKETQVLLVDAGNDLYIVPRGTEFGNDGQVVKRSGLRLILFWILRIWIYLTRGIDLANFNLSDVLTDLDFCKRSAPLGGNAHKGFLDSYESVWESEVLPWVEEILRDRGPLPIRLAGHSLGASIATLMAAGLVEAGYKDLIFGVYLYGSPRVGDWRFRNCLNQTIGDLIFRHENNNDIVVFLPLWIMGFCHVGIQFYLSTQRRTFRSPALWFLIWDRLKGRFASILDGLDDHLIRNYRKALEG